MKKLIAQILTVIMLLSAVPVFAEPLPYVIVSEFNDGEEMGAIVKANENFSKDFTLIAVQSKDDMVLNVKTISKNKLSNGREIAFTAVDGAKVEFFAWDSLASLSPAKENYLEGLTYENVMAQLKKANDYWIGRNSILRNSTNPWEVGVYHTGNMQAYYMTGDEAYRNYSTLWSKVHSWQSYDYPWSTTNADNICCFQTYIDLYNIDKDESYLTYVKPQVDSIADSNSLSYWDWIDAFYMAAPTFTKMYKLTGDVKYLDKMYNMVKYTAETLNCYDEETGLWFRDASFINNVSENGEPVFWSRGDGWVYGAFARIIEDIPDSYEHKEYFVNIFCEMSAALKKAQCPEGAWHESLLDPNYNPTCEESGTGFFVYGLMWGINNGYLDESEYLDCALHGWKWLSEVALQESGLVGYVQHIGAAPTKYELNADTTQHYAYANFVFAASEVAKYLGGMQGDVLPYLQKKLLGNIEVYKMDSSYYIKDGEVKESAQPLIIEDEGDVKVLKDDTYIFMEDFLSEGMYAYENNGIYVISEFITPFNKTEINLITMLSDILDNGKFPERPYSDPERLGVSANLPDNVETDIKNLISISKENVTGSAIHQIENVPENVVDKNLNTRYSVEVLDPTKPEYVQLDMGKVYEINKVGLAFTFGYSRTTQFSVSVSTDGENYTQVLDYTSSSGKTDNIEYYTFDATEARYVRIYGYGNSNVDNYWFSISEVEICKVPDENESEEPSGPQVPSDPETDGLTSVDFSVSSSIVTEPMNGPDNVKDGNFTSYCVLYVQDQTKPEYMQFDLGEVMDVSKVALAFRNGTTRISTFHISVSEDGEDFTTVVPKSDSSGTTAKYEFFDINTNARYIRVYGYSNTYNTYWFSVTEAEVFVKPE